MGDVGQHDPCRPPITHHHFFSSAFAGSADLMSKSNGPAGTLAVSFVLPGSATSGGSFSLATDRPAGGLIELRGPSP